MISFDSISWKCTEEEYRKDSAISYSTLSKFSREGFSNLAHLYDKVESPSLTFGSIVDTLITGTQEEFENKYIVAEFAALPDSQILVLKELFNSLDSSYKTLPLNKIPDSMILAATTVCKFQQNWKPETRVRVIRENGEDYWDMLCLSDKKTIISTKDYHDALACKEKLLTSKSTKWYFEQDNPFEDSLKNYYQLKFKGIYLNVHIKCMADLIKVDYKNHIIYPVDLKTSGHPEYYFPESFIAWRYFYQAGMYAEIIKQNIKGTEFEDYLIAPYRFIVINRTTLTPLVWVYNQTWETGEVEFGDTKFRGWREELLTLNHYLVNNPNVPLGIKENDINIIETYFDGQTI